MPSASILRARWRGLFVEREIYFRAEGRVRFVRLTARAQARVAVLAALVMLAAAVAGTAGVAARIAAARDRAAADRAEAVAARGTAALGQWRRSGAGLARTLAERQRLLEALVRTRLGAAPAPAAAGEKTGAALPDLHRLEVEQDGTARRLAALFAGREVRAAAALRTVGLDPAAVLTRARIGEGGPLLPWPGGAALMTPGLRLLAAALDRFSVLSDALARVPTGTPTAAQMMTSSYGIRTDPFTGALAFHPGLDFVGRQGQPIWAAATGRVSYVGDRTGYGHVVEIDHGHGVLTRYAHLSGFTTRIGTPVTRGVQVGRMGSTGRSTGTHLHFEVRIDGRPVDPRRFLAADGRIADVR